MLSLSGSDWLDRGYRDYRNIDIPGLGPFLVDMLMISLAGGFSGIT